MLAAAKGVFHAELKSSTAATGVGRQGIPEKREIT